MIHKRIDAAYAIYGIDWYRLNDDQQDYIEHWLSVEEYCDDLNFTA